MNKKIILSSVLAIVLCVSIAVGATFAIFTSESQVNIAVTSGKVKVEASLGTPTTYSMGAAQTAGMFQNGGTAVTDGKTLTLDKLTPGDKAVFQIKIANQSDVNVLYRYGYKVKASEGGDIATAKKLYSGLVFTLGEVQTKKYVSYFTKWAALTADETLSVSVELPVEADNTYQELSGTIEFNVEAVQGNADVENVEEFECEIADEAGLTEALDAINSATDVSAATIKLAGDMSFNSDDNGLTVGAGKDVTIDLAGKNLDVVNVAGDGVTVGSGATLTLGNSGDSGKYNFETDISSSDCIFVGNYEDNGKTTTLNIEGDLEINVGSRANSAIHAYGEKGNVVVNMDGAKVNINATSQTSALIADQNSSVVMKNTVFNLTADFAAYSDGNDVVGILLWGQNGKQDNISVTIEEGTVFNVGGKNAFVQGIQIGMKNGYSSNLNVVINGGKFNLSPSENGEGYAFTARKGTYGSFVMNGGEVTGNVTALAAAYIGEVDLTIKGGSFVLDPTQYVNAETHTVTKSATADVWTVAAK